MIFNKLDEQGVDITYYLYLKFIKKIKCSALTKKISILNNNMIIIYLETVIIDNTIQNKKEPIEFISPI